MALIDACERTWPQPIVDPGARLETRVADGRLGEFGERGRVKLLKRSMLVIVLSSAITVIGTFRMSCGLDDNRMLNIVLEHVFVSII